MWVNQRGRKEVNSNWLVKFKLPMSSSVNSWADAESMDGERGFLDEKVQLGSWASGRGWDCHATSPHPPTPQREIAGGGGYSIVQGRKTQILLFQGLDVL